MKYQEIYLKDINNAIKTEAKLCCYIPDNFQEYCQNRKRRAMLIIPGGAYTFVSEREAEPIALRLIGEDIASFVLKYTVGPYKDEKVPLLEAYTAILYIRQNAENFHLDENKIGAIGFSAGGHFASCLPLYSEEYLEILGCNKEDLKIDIAVLSYPVISMKKELTHLETRYNRTLEDEKLVRKYSIEDHINEDYPPTFIWCTAEDKLVPALNSLILAQKLLENKVEVELHMYPHGVHGLALANEITNVVEKDVQNWIINVIRFIKNH